MSRKPTNLRPASTHVPTEIFARHARKSEIGHDNIDFLSLQDRECLFRRAHFSPLTTRFPPSLIVYKCTQSHVKER